MSYLLNAHQVIVRLLMGLFLSGIVFDSAGINFGRAVLRNASGAGSTLGTGAAWGRQVYVHGVCVAAVPVTETHKRSERASQI